MSTLTLPAPVRLDLRISPGPRPRVVGSEPAPAEPVPYETAEFPLWVQLDPATREIRAFLAPIPRPLPLYGPDDYAAAVTDTLDDHATRTLELLGDDPAAILQALIDGHELPALPPRVPREIANWRARAVLDVAGLLPAVEGAIAAMEGEAGIAVRHAWHSAAPLLRRGPTVAALAPALGLSAAQVDDMFRQAELLVV